MTNDSASPRDRLSTTPQGPAETSASSQGSHPGATEDRVSAASEAVRDNISRTGQKAADKMKEAAEQRAHFVARQVGGVGEALEKVGDELRNSDQGHVGDYARTIGTQVKDVARRMEGKSTGEIARMAEDFGRRQPLAFLGLAALAGLTASRFLMASAQPTSSGAAGSAPKSAADRPSTTTSTTAQGGTING